MLQEISRVLMIPHKKMHLKLYIVYMMGVVRDIGQNLKDCNKILSATPSGWRDTVTGLTKQTHVRKALHANEDSTVFEAQLLTKKL